MSVSAIQTRSKAECIYQGSEPKYALDAATFFVFLKVLFASELYSICFTSVFPSKTSKAPGYTCTKKVIRLQRRRHEENLCACLGFTIDMSQNEFHVKGSALKTGVL